MPAKSAKAARSGAPATRYAAGAAANGTLLEAAFVDPAYPWPPPEGQGRNAVELPAGGAGAATLADDDASVTTTASLRDRMRMPVRPAGFALWKCCGSNGATVDSVAFRAYETRRREALQARREYAQLQKARTARAKAGASGLQKYSLVPEGILVYRLDTSKRLLQLMSHPHAKTDLTALVSEMTVVRAAPSPDATRRGLVLTGDDGTVVTLVACEQRTATAWLEAMSLMVARSRMNPLARKFSLWNKEKLKEEELVEIEDAYLNLAHYSNKLIRAGALPGGKRGSGGAGGIYYSIERVEQGGEGGDVDEFQEEEALEAIAKRRAVIKDSWDFYRMICSLLRDRNKYEEAFRRLQLDPVYPYLNSMTGLNDPGDVGYENPDKTVMQADLPGYAEMSKTQVARQLVQQAEAALPSLVEICKALAGSLGMEEVGIGPVKEADAALRKAEKKYNGDLLRVTDYCRALLVVKDLPSLLALLELARDSFGPLIRRVKLSSLKGDHRPKPGGYRDCIINVELKGHICEIQVHIWPMWVICGVDGFRHYRHALEYNTDSFEDAYDALDGLDRKTIAELVVIAEEAVAETPLNHLQWYHEKYILDYHAEAGLFMKHGLDVWAELILRQLLRLRMDAPDIGPDHHETIILYKHLAKALRAQNNYEEAKEFQAKVEAAEALKNKEKKQAEQSIFDSILNAPAEAFDMILDPNRKEREEEEKLKKDVKASKKRWRMIRAERFAFLDADVPGRKTGVEEKKTDGSSKL